MTPDAVGTMFSNSVGGNYINADFYSDAFDGIGNDAFTMAFSSSNYGDPSPQDLFGTHNGDALDGGFAIRGSSGEARIQIGGSTLEYDNPPSFNTGRNNLWTLVFKGATRPAYLFLNGVLVKEFANAPDYNLFDTGFLKLVQTITAARVM